MRNEILASVDESIAEIDWFGVLGDERIGPYFEMEWKVKVLGRGHVKRIKDQLQEEKEVLFMTIPL
jgi:UDP-N-acetyl-D-glucosamine dehydrogenase